MTGTHDPNWWRELGPYLDRALELPPADRAAWLAQLQHDRPAIARRLDVLLREHEALGRDRFLELGPAAPLNALPVAAGEVVGPYTLIRPIGEGGMATVWLAERTDGELQQQVAVKFLGTPLDRPGWRERFLRERQLLTSLSHASVVRVLDAGHTDRGHPYLVMEYVDGSPIDVHAGDLPLRQRLELFVRTCDAVAYAHRRLIIHRDLKPSNILVDRSGQPKLLDFGIARLLDDPDVTRTVDRLFTPGYASPEQLVGAAHTTATDVYSLGAVLYKLVTGRSPRDAGTTSGSSSAGGTLPAASRLNPAVPPDLDFILRKALRDEPDERYASVDALADDVRALLESRPVGVRADDAWYRARMFVRRHRVPIAAVLLVIVSLSAGLYAVNRERAIAHRRFMQVRQLAGTFIGLDEVVRALPGSTTVRERIVSEALQYLSALGEEALGDDALALELARSYQRVARVQGVPTAANLGKLRDAEESLHKGDALVEAVLTRDDANPDALFLSGEIVHDLMTVLDVQRRREESVWYAQRAGARLERLTSLPAFNPEHAYLVVHMLGNIGVALGNVRQFEEAIRYSRRALEVAAAPAAETARGPVLGVLAFALWQSGDLETALETAAESVDLVERTAAGGHATLQANLINALWRKGMILGKDTDISLGRTAEALEVFDRALELAEAHARKDPEDALSRRNVAKVSLEIGDIMRHTNPAGALAVYDAALVRLREIPATPRARRDEARLLASSSHAERWLGHEAAAAQRIERALQLLEELELYPAARIEPASEADLTLRALAAHYAETKRPDRAADTYQDLLTKILAWNPRLHSDPRDALVLATIWSGLAEQLHRLGRADEARELEAREAELRSAWAGRIPERVFARRPSASLALR